MAVSTDKILFPFQLTAQTPTSIKRIRLLSLLRYVFLLFILQCGKMDRVTGKAEGPSRITTDLLKFMRQDSARRLTECWRA